MAHRALPKNGQVSLTRRELLRLAWWATAGLLTAESAGITLATLWPQVKAGSFGGKIVIGKIDDFKVGDIIYADPARAYISRLETGFLALYRKCTHLGCVVPWRAGEVSEDDLVSKGRFNCPCHGSIFNRYGLVRGGPAPRPLDIFPITFEGDKVVVDTGTIVERTTFEESQVARV